MGKVARPSGRRRHSVHRHDENYPRWS